MGTMAWRGGGSGNAAGCLRAAALLVALVAAALPARAADATDAAEAAPPATVAVPAAGGEVPLRYLHREVMVFRAPWLGIAPADRARRARLRLDELLATPGTHAVTVAAAASGPQAVQMVQVDGATAFLVTPADADNTREEAVPQAAARAAAALRTAIDDARESRDPRRWAEATLKAGAATAVLLALLWAASRLRRAATRHGLQLAQRHAERLRVGGAPLLLRERARALVPRLAWLPYWLVLGPLLYYWFSHVLAQFAVTRAVSEQLDAWLLGRLAGLAAAVATALPDLAVAVLIFLLARGAVKLLDGFFTRVQDGQIRLGWLDADLALPTRRIGAVLVWLFALAMAYPYLPGAQTEAFKGLSVLVGLMVTIGASNLVGQAGSGLILTYSRVFRRGEYVRIAEHEGTVVDVGMFATRVRTGLGEELTLPNAFILGTVTRNYSRAVQGEGYVVDTTVTIGYDTPWRQVHALLEDAARRPPGVLAAPAPQVFQTALNDFYVAYRLVCQAIPSAPRPRAEVLAALHAHIQDCFAEAGVQIMSPHYLGDPAAPKVPPAPPAA